MTIHRELENLDDIPVFINASLPAECDGIRLTVGDGEISHSEDWGQDSTLQSTASGYGLVRVQGGTGLFVEHIGYNLFNSRDTGCSSNDFH